MTARLLAPLTSVGRAWLAILGCGRAAPVAAAPVGAGFERFHRDGPPGSEEGGLLLLGELNCVACHRLPGAERLPPRPAPALRDVGARLGSAALAAFVAHPAEVKPGTLMPRTALAAGEVTALTAYLGTLGRPRPDPAPPAGSVEAGRALYHAVGCVACHAADAARPGPPAAGAPSAPGRSAVVPLALGARYDRAALIRFLVDPLEVRPAGRMPDSHLTPAEAADVAAYLQREQGSPPAAPAPAPPATGSPAGGRPRCGPRPTGGPTPRRWRAAASLRRPRPERRTSLSTGSSARPCAPRCAGWPRTRPSCDPVRPGTSTVSSPG
ncbi:MAG: cytochrome c [Opitutaceae bacterium]